MLTAKVLSKGQVVIPKEARDKIGLAAGDRVEVKVTDEGLTIIPLKKGITDDYAGVVKGRLSLDELERLYAEQPE